MMISNYVLEHLDSCDKDMLHAICKELLAYREAERTIWQNAPEWANWFARDDDGMERFFAEKPLPSEGGWVLPEDAYDSLQSPRLTDNWQTTLQERPK